MGTTPIIEQGATPIEVKEVSVKIEGHELISKKLFDIVMHLLVDNDVASYDCITAIIFSPDLPEGKYGHFNTGTREISINLQRQFDFAVEMVKDEELSYLSLKGHIWYGLLRTVIHEICHAMAFAIDPDTMLGEDREAIEESIDEEAGGHLAKLIRDYDVEPAEMADEPFFGSRYMEFHVKSIKENAEQWAINQNDVHKTGFIWKHDEAVCNTFREWYRASYNFEADTEWDKDVDSLIGAKVELAEEVSEAIELPVAEEEVIVALTDDVSKELVEAVATSDVEKVVVPNTIDIEPLTGIDPETMSLLSMDEPGEEGDMRVGEEPIPDYPTIVIADSALDPATQLETSAVVEEAPVLVQQELPLKVETASELCRNCNIVLTADAKFCASCGTGIEATPMPALPEAPEVAAALPHAAPITHQVPFSSGAKRPMRHDLPNYNLSAEQIRACVGEVLSRCYQHIFSKCGFLPGQNPSFAPELRNAITEPVSVVGVPCIDQIMVGMDSIDPMTGAFTWCVPAVGSMIRGKITKNQGIPSYTLYFNFNGHEAKRLIIPQNQWKVSADGTSYSGPAQRAQQGAMIVWLIDGDDSTPGKKWRAKIENGTLEWMI